jgi:hypothetical protein
MQGWHRGFFKGQTGLVPSTHLKAGSWTIQGIQTPLGPASVPARGLLKGPLPVPSTPVEDVASSTTGTLRVKASHDYTARQPDELSFAQLEDLDVYPDCVEVMVVVSHVDIYKEDEILVLTLFRTCSRAGIRDSSSTKRAALSQSRTLTSLR